MKKKFDAEVLKFYRQGLSVVKISQKLGISRQCIYNILNRNSINYKKPSRNIDVAAIKGDLKHLKINAVMKKHKLNYAQIRKIMKSENIERREIMKDVLKVEDIRRLYLNVRMSDKQIADLFNCSEYTVRSFRWQNGIYQKHHR